MKNKTKKQTPQESNNKIVKWCVVDKNPDNIKGKYITLKEVTKKSVCNRNIKGYKINNILDNKTNGKELNKDVNKV